MNYLGEIRVFAGDFAPPGWAACDGKILPIQNNERLFSLIGTTYGGDYERHLALPDLRGRCALHRTKENELGTTGTVAFSLWKDVRGGLFGGRAPGYMALNFIIALDGEYPLGGFGGEPFLGEGKLFAFDFVPDGWARCDGQLLEIKENQALFALLGTTYGGDGQTTFALPDLRGSIATHQETLSSVGEYTEITGNQTSKSQSIDFLVLNSCIALTGIFPEPW